MSVDKEKVEAVIEQIRPRLQMDGGDIALKEVTDDGEVQVELQGACAGCPMSQYTLAMQVESVLKDQVPGVTKIVPV
ncbi:MAG: NifU family protein [Coriobacteriia bacterium]|nr:NifU family protein [Coriobacteriia bacterium]